MSVFERGIKMRIGIIGGGSIGLLFSYYLSERFEVTLYTRTKDQADAIGQNGIQLKYNGQALRREIKTNSFENWHGEEDLTFIAVKQYHLKTIMKQLIEKKTVKTDFIFLQNGMGHLKLLELLNSETIYVSTVEHGAFKCNPYTVEHNGVGQTKLALFKGSNTLPNSLFLIHGFPIVFESDYYQMLIKKLVINAIINPLTAILRVTNGEIIQNEHYSRVARNLFSEIAEILNLEDVESYFLLVLEVCQRTSTNRSSMLKDIEQNNQTEVDSIIGFILEEAERKKIKAPISQMLYDFIKGSES
jgi:2-dehydropantoate 2-reductase